jgi:3-deoxy-7-phosphoheptulonate synthase
MIPAVRRISDTNVSELRPLPAPGELLAALPQTEAQAALVDQSRDAIRRILGGDDPRLLAIVGPCSIHDIAAGRDYGRRLAALAQELDDRVLVVMRAYFEKPRTSVGWPGLILDPHLDGSSDIAYGLELARQFLRSMLDLGLPTATEFLDPISPQYLADLVCWAAIGARTSESQIHRQLASGLSMPVGFKNSTDGNVLNAIHAVQVAARPQAFFGLTATGCGAAVRTQGNPDCHVVLRGGSDGPNYSEPQVAAVETRLKHAGLSTSIVVDCSHDNSGRRPERQPEILREVVGQITAGNRSIVGVMVESNLMGGKQPWSAAAGKLRYGVSITDGCLDWAATEQCLRATHAALAPRFATENNWERVTIGPFLPGAPLPIDLIGSKAGEIG